MMWRLCYDEAVERAGLHGNVQLVALLFLALNIAAPRGNKIAFFGFASGYLDFFVASNCFFEALEKLV